MYTPVGGFMFQWRRKAEGKYIELSFEVVTPQCNRMTLVQDMFRHEFEWTLRELKRLLAGPELSGHIILASDHPDAPHDVSCTPAQLKKWVAAAEAFAHDSCEE
jgi:hypothetical protein